MRWKLQKEARKMSRCPARQPRGSDGKHSAVFIRAQKQANSIDKRADYIFGCLSLLITQDESQVDEAGALVQIRQSCAEFVDSDIRTGF